MPPIEVDREGRLLLSVHVQPGASQSRIVGRHGDALKIRVAAPPEAGRANQAVVDLLAETLGLSRHAVELVSGRSSRHKCLRITGLTPEQLAARLPVPL
jgi:uncharacterized protein (TIGR00251 family)